MRSAEGVARDVARGDRCVFADGPLHELGPHEVVGVRQDPPRHYLPAGTQRRSIAALAPGQRTPLFAIKDYGRYSWYVRLATPTAAIVGGRRALRGVGALPRATVRAMADRTAAVLPLVASQEHLDPRAPQNLVPIAALERELRHLMGDRGLVYRAIRSR